MLVEKSAMGERQARASLRLQRVGALVGAVVVIVLAAAACGGGDEKSLTVYSGRSAELIGPLLERFTEESGIEVGVRYAGTAELAALLLEEGDRSPADVFIAQDAGARGPRPGQDLHAT